MKAGEPDLGQMPRRIDPELAELTRWCLGRRFPIDRTRQRAVPKLVRQVIRRRRLSVLAHVHLVAAFRGALARGPIDSVLAV